MSAREGRPGISKNACVTSPWRRSFGKLNQPYNRLFTTLPEQVRRLEPNIVTCLFILLFCRFSSVRCVLVRAMLHQRTMFFNYHGNKILYVPFPGTIDGSWEKYTLKSWLLNCRINSRLCSTLQVLPVGICCSRLALT
jgi:hypothetical protein